MNHKIKALHDKEISIQKEYISKLEATIKEQETAMKKIWKLFLKTDEDKGNAKWKQWLAEEKLHGAHIRAANYRTEVNFYQHLYGDAGVNEYNKFDTYMKEKMGLDKSIILALGSKIGGEFIRKYLKSTKRKAKKK